MKAIAFFICSVVILLCGMNTAQAAIASCKTVPGEKTVIVQKKSADHFLLQKAEADDSDEDDTESRYHAIVRFLPSFLQVFVLNYSTDTPVFAAYSNCRTVAPAPLYVLNGVFRI